MCTYHSFDWVGEKSTKPVHYSVSLKFKNLKNNYTPSFDNRNMCSHASHLKIGLLPNYELPIDINQPTPPANYNFRVSF